MIRVPVEVVKQRTQANRTSSLHNFKVAINEQGLRGLYRGYLTTVMREIPFSFIQFPLWEYLKKKTSQRTNTKVKPWQAMVCGAVSGGIAAFLTTPLDVAKTRIILADKSSILASGNILTALSIVWRENQIRG